MAGDATKVLAHNVPPASLAQVVINFPEALILKSSPVVALGFRLGFRAGFTASLAHVVSDFSEALVLQSSLVALR
jgi:hypothetical protein